MDNTFLTQITNGTIEDVETGRNGSFVLVSYRDCPNCGMDNQTIRLNVSNNTVILDEKHNRIPLRSLQKGMTVNAAFSNATTRSIPPQAAAYVIQIVGRALQEEVTVGRIVDVDRQNRSFTTISDGNLSSVIRFNGCTDFKQLWQADEFCEPRSRSESTGASRRVYDNEHSAADNSV